ncbi:HAD superfamily hydrolase Cof [Mycoplasma haemocanis str. Illinois]|uniref:HAD superfamily hydrolase Cof n=1 Tax=Mycoplasma haemocanis (strain Illinois) TaxID=1111676 RepID=H6N8K7_MYCHN|nr:HAD-IIB family hydrolase [Mycoplasma haemocanis]AEW45979.1 HAD superfamily hydrolase Cof [Mycoplasma haemocanis str. Illinois]
MSNYKYLVLSDLDGTLLNSEGLVSEGTKKFVHEINKRDDILFCFSTGRCWRDCKRIYEELELKGFVSCCNGAFIYNPREELVRYSFISEKLWTFFLQNSYFTEGLLKGDVLTDKGNFSLTEDNGQEVLSRLRDCKANVYGIKTYFNYRKPTPELELKFVKRINDLKQLDCPPSLTIFHYPDILNLEIHANYVNKERAVEFLGNYYGIAPNNILTFGDQVNDLSVAMGTSRFCAVGNALDSIKQVSNRISEYSNDEDGVVKELQVFLNKEI